MSKERVLVTGAAGFIGSHVAEHCLGRGFEVVGLDDLSGGMAENVPSGTDFAEGSVVDHEFVARLWAEKGPFDHVYHLAAYAAEGLSHFIRRFNYSNNVIGSMNLINEAVKGEAKSFVFTSSIAVYGAGQLPMSEDMTPEPEDPYGVAKYAVELDLAAAARMFGLNYTIFRPHNVYGEKQNICDRYRNVVGIFMNQVMRNEPMTVFGDGEQTRAFTYIDDVAPIIARAPLVEGARNAVFNIGAETPYTVNQIAKEVAASFGKECRIAHLPERNEVKHAFSDHERVRRVFAPPAPVDLKTGVERMARWARSQRLQESPRFKAIEITRNLPPSWAG